MESLRLHLLDTIRFYLLNNYRIAQLQIEQWKTSLTCPLLHYTPFNIKRWYFLCINKNRVSPFTWKIINYPIVLINNVLILSVLSRSFTTGFNEWSIIPVNIFFRTARDSVAYKYLPTFLHNNFHRSWAQSPSKTQFHAIVTAGKMIN